MQILSIGSLKVRYPVLPVVKITAGCSWPLDSSPSVKFLLSWIDMSWWGIKLRCSVDKYPAQRLHRPCGSVISVWIRAHIFSASWWRHRFPSSESSSRPSSLMCFLTHILTPSAFLIAFAQGTSHISGGIIHRDLTRGENKSRKTLLESAKPWDFLESGVQCGRPALCWLSLLCNQLLLRDMQFSFPLLFLFPNKRGLGVNSFWLDNIITLYLS